MESGKRFGFSVVEKNKIWSRWKAGQSLHEIGRAFDKPHSSIRCLLLPRGGIRPVAKLLQINFRPVLRRPPEPAAFIRSLLSGVGPQTIGQCFELLAKRAKVAELLEHT